MVVVVSCYRAASAGLQLELELYSKWRKSWTAPNTNLFWPKTYRPLGLKRQASVRQLKNLKSNLKSKSTKELLQKKINVLE